MHFCILTPGRPLKTFQERPMSHQLPTVHILYENPAWLPPLTEALEAEGFPVRLVPIDSGLLDPSQEPPAGLWINRISPSSHTRGHNHSVGLTREILAWLRAHRCRVINGLDAFELEMSKLRQDIALRRHGILTPKTLLAVGKEKIIEAASRIDGPFITKHNQGGKGLGIQLFQSIDGLRAYLDSDAFDEGPDGKIILQQYIKPAEPHITRVELVGGQFLFAMNSATDGGFELCPSDACQLPLQAPDVCPAEDAASKFSAADIQANDPLVQKYLRLCALEGIEVAGIEFITAADGKRYTYDINGTTNYSGVLAKQTGVHGMKAFARYVRSMAGCASLEEAA
jgi:hypothetical protein